jgi:signal transduction histidine kinase
MSFSIDPTLSLFDLVDRLNTRRLFANYRGSLVNISREIEDAIINSGAQARVFAGFQKMSFFLPQVARYRRLARSAERIWVFGVPDVTPPAIDNVTYVPLSKEDRLTQEWFLVADSREFFSALVAQDLSGFDVPQYKRKFRGIWTFDADMVGILRDWLSGLVGMPVPREPEIQRDYVRQLNQIGRTAENLIDKLETRNAELHRIQALSQDLTSMLVHDLGNPIASIVSYLELSDRMIQQGDTATVQKFIGSARAASESLMRMLRDILDINRMESGEFKIEQKPIVVNDLLNAIKVRFSGLAKLDQKRYEVEPAEKLTAYGDEDILLRVLANLIGNAFKYTVSGDSISVTAKPSANTQFVEIIVKDSGQGIPKDFQERIFDKFGQVEGEGNNRRGYGLGLTFCRMAVEAFGGSITVDSDLGKGSTFTITLRSVPPDLSDRRDDALIMDSSHSN